MANPDSRELTDIELDLLNQEDSFQMLKRIFSLVLKMEGQDEEFELKKLEAFSSLEGQGKKHQKSFKNKQRVQGEMFVAWFINNPILTIVVDPTRRSLVRINEVEQNGEQISIKKLLEKAGFKLSDYADTASYKAAVEEYLDGQQAMSTTYESPINLVAPEEADPVFGIRALTNAKVTDNSKGIFVKV